MKTTTSLMVFALLSVFAITSCRESPPELDRPFSYTNAQEPEYDSLTVSSEYAPMSDGTELAGRVNDFETRPARIYCRSSCE